ncbi:MAG TPA: hypothetical protein VH089_21505 [Streptosporangiaceae bacterium]|nr:hypothetical protein [Streptosporangiaceae bacterium]
MSDHDNGAGGVELVVTSPHWRLRVDWGDRVDPYELVHLASGRAVADESYCYQLTVSGATDSGFHGGPVRCRRVRPLDWSAEPHDDDGTTLTLLGQLDFGPQGPTGLRLEHRITLTGSGQVIEQLSLLNQAGQDQLRLDSFRFGFRKTLFDRGRWAWSPGCEDAELIPVPLRRFRAQDVDHLRSGYRAADLYPSEWPGRGSLPDRGAEAWLWAEAGGGFLVAKYTQEHAEYGLADGEHVVARRPAGPAASLQLDQLHSDRNLCLRHGGAGRHDGFPETARELSPGQRLGFGASIIVAYDGDWQAGYARYKQVLRDRGHVTPAGYDPRVHWNELYRLGWRCGSNAPLQELPELFAEAARARAAGAQAFYFDPGWDLFEGSSVWDTGRLGPVEEFVRRLREEYGLSLALHLMIHTKSVQEDPAIYRRRPDGAIDLWTDRTPYSGGYVCPAAPVWQRQKTERLLGLARAGVSFFMFDFVTYGPCWSAGHGHGVPSTREEHAAGIMTVVRAVKAEFPALAIEAHDRIGGGLPLYYQHGSDRDHDELWGFEYMWDPYADLLSGRALSLYEYNLAYDIPLYLHINSAHDSPALLAFWWYASCCRHLGIGGLAEGDAQWPRLVEAMGRYRELQPWFARGRFVGIDRFTHLHVLDEGGAVLTAFNLTASPVRRTVAITPAQLEVAAAPQVAGAPSTLADGVLTIDLDLPPLSPLVVEIDTSR